VNGESSKWRANEPTPTKRHDAATRSCGATTNGGDDSSSSEETSSKSDCQTNACEMSGKGKTTSANANAVKRSAAMMKSDGVAMTKTEDDATKTRDDVRE